MTDQGDHFNLCKEDADMLDRLVDVGFEIDRLDGLSDEEQRRALGRAARRLMIDDYDLQKTCLPRQLSWVDSVMRSAPPGPPRD